MTRQVVGEVWVATCDYWYEETETYGVATDRETAKEISEDEYPGDITWTDLKNYSYYVGKTFTLYVRRGDLYGNA